MNEGNRLVVVLTGDSKQALSVKRLIKTANEKTVVFVTDCADMAYKVIRRKAISLLIIDFESISRAEELIYKIRGEKILAYLPVIILHPTDKYRIKAHCEWNCMGYYKKPFCEWDIVKKIEHILAAELPDERDNSFVIRRHNVRYVVKVRELICVRYFERSLHLYMSNGDVLMAEQRPLQMIFELAGARCLMQCCRGVMVNLMYVERVCFRTKQIWLKNGEKLKIGNAYEKQIKEAWSGVDDLIKRNEEEMKE